MNFELDIKIKKEMGTMCTSSFHACICSDDISDGCSAYRAFEGLGL